MEILFLASEVAPWSKSGGLGDVAGALPQALALRGHAVTVVTPRYGTIDAGRWRLAPMKEKVHVGADTASLFHAAGPVRTVFVDHERFFGRRGLYGEGGHDYPDNAERFAFFARAALQIPKALHFRPHVVHLHDWQSALAAWLLRSEARGEPSLARAKSVFTVHNLAYQGVFDRGAVERLGLPWDVFRHDALEFYDQLSFVKAGLVYADAITTVSPTYAREILTPEQGCGLDGLMRSRAQDLHGILNGIDEKLWDPRTDKHLPAHYDASDLGNKRTCKARLQRELGLPERDVPLVGMIGRLVEQKGLDLVAASLGEILEQECQLAVLGSGAREYEELFLAAARDRPAQVAVRIGFDEGLAHRIEAGADAFLMPSRFEPCGLNQMYSLRYGTVPVVRAVGGLADTVSDWDGSRRGTGFTFRDYRPDAMLTAVRRALDAWRDREAWRGLQTRGMAQDFTWNKSAERYEELFESLR